MKKKIIALLTVMTLLVSMLAACSFDKKEDPASADTKKEEPVKKDDSTGKKDDKPVEKETVAEPKVARLISGGEPGSLHPALAQGTHESIILDHVFEGLTKRDENLDIVNGMAKDIQISEDGLTYTATLRDDIFWSNGDKVVAGDFEYAWKYALDPATASDYAWQISTYLVGANDYNSYSSTDKDGNEKPADQVAKEKAELADKVGVKALDEKTVEIKLINPTPYFLELLAFYTYYPIPQKVQESDPLWASEGDTFVSNGPFTITEWNHDESVVADKNDKYYNADVVKLDGLEFVIMEDMNTEWQMYQSGEIDLNFNLPPEVLAKLRAEKNPELITESELAIYYYNFNTQIKPFNNLKVRKALSMAINRKVLVEDVAQGGQFPAFGVVPPGVADADGEFRANGGEYFAENFEEAKKLLAEGLAEEGMDKLDFTLLYNTNEAHKKIAIAIQEMWRALGVGIDLENTEFRVKIDREQSMDYTVSRAGWIGDYIDPNTFLDLFTSWNSQNNTGWASEEYDKLIDDASKEFEPAKRFEYLHKAEEMLMENLPIMPIYYYTKSRMIKPYLTGVNKAINRDVCLIYADMEK